MISLNSSDDLIRELAMKYDIDDIGFTRAERIKDSFKTKKIWNGQWIPDSRFHNPKLVYPWAKSIIIGILSYYKEREIVVNSKYGIIARYTTGDYYHLLRKKLSSLAKDLRKIKNIKTSKVYTNGPFDEKEYAYRAGLGFKGRNGLLINKKLGSFFLIGMFLIDTELNFRKTSDNLCSDCSKCEQNCPTSALSNGFVDRNKCLQELTQRAVPIPIRIKEVWGDRFYGCDACQEACPFNDNLQYSKNIPLRGKIGYQIDLQELLSMNADKIKTKFKGNQIGSNWIKIQALIKNAFIVLGNNNYDIGADLINRYVQCKDRSIQDSLSWYHRKR